MVKHREMGRPAPMAGRGNAITSSLAVALGVFAMLLPRPAPAGAGVHAPVELTGAQMDTISAGSSDSISEIAIMDSASASAQVGGTQLNLSAGPDQHKELTYITPDGDKVEVSVTNVSGPGSSFSSSSSSSSSSGSGSVSSVSSSASSSGSSVR